MLDQAQEERRTDGDYVEFRTTGASAAGDYHCSDCGYGVRVQSTLPRCPMCGGTTWEPHALARPFARPLGPLH